MPWLLGSMVVPSRTLAKGIPMANQSLAGAIADDPGLDERRTVIFKRAYALACMEQNLALRESGRHGAHAVFDRDRGEMRIVVDLQRLEEGDVEEALDLRILELGCLVFHVTARRLRTERGRGRTVVDLLRDTSSYWEAILAGVSGKPLS